MKLLTATNLICPIDGKKLTLHNHSLICSNGHNFDQARQGYFNLLVVQNKASLDPGDTKEMVMARRQFLETGCFAGISDSINALVAKHLLTKSQLLSKNQPFTILDAGCGEGYYLSRITDIQAESVFPDTALIGMDISKWAIRSAAQRHRQINWIVGSNARPPFLANSIDLILCAFGFPSFAVFRQLLKPHGQIIMVDPAPNHLLELRQHIYSELKSRTLSSADATGFELADLHNLTYFAALDNQESIQNLFRMTPHFFRSPPEAKIAIAALPKLDFTVDVSLRVLIKT